MIEPYTIVTASNDNQMLSDNLLKSKAISSATDVIVQKGYQSASKAYNDAIEKSKTDLIIFTHQDIYLPPNWCSELYKSISILDVNSSKWGVLGVWGVSTSGIHTGFMYCNAFGDKMGQSFESPKEVQTLDEVVLVIRKSSGLRFDNNLHGFHLYGSDLCLTADSMSLKNYVVSAFCVHNSTNYHAFPRDFWSSYKYLRKKWIKKTPIHASCTTITKSMKPMITSIIERNIRRIIKGGAQKPRIRDPKSFYSDVLETQAND
ncbi:hypothetical protein IEN85_16390 [Pelagicoccus sp. NFK12]|uniref:Streptomycin biosynthesis protein StrF domain-containing protein n=1 Tax=Pelagicoccus enzymogenes TaxID=2773457 RepID=A0A927IIQ5_9BACT|nr:glycosyltransferase family A protein [Pelagicoccus enzymogenes]MBD5781079.1 hypothetical protein [Pelagicoccus enzymogenes]